MHNIFLKFKEVTIAVMPVAIIVIILNFTVSPLPTFEFIRFIIGVILVIAGLSLLLFGVDIGITPVGSLLGKTLAKSNKYWIVIMGGLLLGFFVSVAEPDLHIIAQQADSVTSGQIPKFGLIIAVSIGISLAIALGLIRVIRSIPLYKILAVMYFIIFVLALFIPPAFLSVSFDSSGATTGAVTVPFILALSLGITSMKKDSKAAEKDSFGLIGIASAGAIISVMAISIISGGEDISGTVNNTAATHSTLMSPFFHKLPAAVIDTAISLSPLYIIFLAFHFTSVRLSGQTLKRTIFGLLYAFIGLVLFLVGVGAGFINVGSSVGFSIASRGLSWLIVLIGFVLGLVTVLAEPAVHVLTHQIEDVTSGAVKHRFVLIALSAGVGLAVALSMLRIFDENIQLWHYLLPGYIIALILAFTGPKLFVGIAFDSGGVASGPMTATFILAFAQGAAQAKEGANVLSDAFGVIAMVALTPLITLQLLGLLYRRRSKKGDI